jgi:hypothetical protein
MRYVRAAVVLLAAMTFSHVAYGQSSRARNQPSHTAIMVMPLRSGAGPAQHTAPNAPNATAACNAGGGAPGGTVCVNVPRYPENPQPVYGIMEYDTITCNETSPGQWAFTNDLTPKLKQPVTTGYATAAVTPPGCGSQQNYTFAVMCFQWTLHNNHSDPSPSDSPPQPEDNFFATWSDAAPTGPGTECNPQVDPGTNWNPSGLTGPFPTTFHVYPPRVIPLGENTTAIGWNQARAIYGMTLQCCNPPQPGRAFDFSGEQIIEDILILDDPCKLGLPPIDEAPTVQQGNTWQPDNVGFKTCVPGAAQIWCSRAGPCSFQYKQTVSTYSQADGPPLSGIGAIKNSKSVPYSTNIQGGTISARTSINPAYKYVTGNISSYRANKSATPPAISLGIGLQAPPNTTNVLQCLSIATITCQ